MNRSILIIFTVLLLVSGTSCTGPRKASVSEQKRGLLMMESEDIYKNKGFYKAKKSKKHRKNTYRASKRKYRKHYRKHKRR